MPHASPVTPSPQEPSLDALVSRAWTAAYAGQAPDEPLSRLRRRLNEAACALPSEAEAIVRAVEKLVRAWDDFSPDLQEQHLAPLFTPTIVGALPDDTFQALLDRQALPDYPGKRVSLRQVLQQELAVRAPLGLERTLMSALAAPEEEILSCCREVDAAYGGLVERWRNGCHFVGMQEAVDGLRGKLEHLIRPPDTEALGALTDSLWQLLQRRFFRAAAHARRTATPREALDEFRAWLGAQPSGDKGLSVVNRKDSLRQPLNLMEQAFKKFLSLHLVLERLDERARSLDEAWHERRKIHDPAQDGFVLRDKHGQLIEILDIVGFRPDAQDWLNTFCEKDAARDAAATTHHLVEQARPFLTGDIPPAQRCRLYDRVACRTFTPRDCRTRLEAGLVGQNMVVAAEDLPPWQCLGVYGGVLLPDAQVRDLDRTYIFDASVTEATPEESFVIDGTNVMCRINTTVSYDEQGRPAGQAKGDEAYNVVALLLQVRLGKNPYGVDSVCVPAAFHLSHDDAAVIRAGEELRLDYEYTPSMVRDL